MLSLKEFVIIRNLHKASTISKQMDQGFRKKNTSGFPSENGKTGKRENAEKQMQNVIAWLLRWMRKAEEVAIHGIID